MAVRASMVTEIRLVASAGPAGGREDPVLLSLGRASNPSRFLQILPLAGPGSALGFAKIG